MAYLSYRQSDQTQTQAQIEFRDIVLNRPLTMYEVDANFAALNGDITDFKTVYGVGAANMIGLSIDEIYGENNANLLDKTGFYSATSQTTNLPTTVLNGSAVLHMESVKQNNAYHLSAVEVTSDETHLWHRIRKGTHDWGQWEKLSNYNDLARYMTTTNAEIDRKVDKAGDTMTGNLALTNNSSLIIVNKEADRDYRTQSTDNSVDINFFDKNGYNKNTYRLGNISSRFVNDDQQTVNEIRIDVNNPTSVTEEDGATMSIGWKKVVVEGVEQYSQFTSVPRPVLSAVDHPDQIATVGWTIDAIDDKIFDTFDASNYVSVNGGHINGSLDIYGALTVSNSIVCDDSIDGLYASLEEGVDSYGPVYLSDNVEGRTYNSLPNQEFKTGVVFGVDQESEDDTEYGILSVGQHGGFVNSVDLDGINTIAMVAKQWSKCANEDAELHTLSISVDSTGAVKTHAPTPSASSMGTEIITAEWIIQNMSVLDFGEM